MDTLFGVMLENIRVGIITCNTDIKLRTAGTILALRPSGKIYKSSNKTGFDVCLVKFLCKAIRNGRNQANR